MDATSTAAGAVVAKCAEPFLIHDHQHPHLCDRRDMNNPLPILLPSGDWLNFNGVMEGTNGCALCFTDPRTGGDLAVPMEQATPEGIAEALAALRRRFEAPGMSALVFSAAVTLQAAAIAAHRP